MTQQIAWTKTVCQLDDNGLYIGQTEADLDTYARDGSYLIPGGCIDAEPPAHRPGQAAKWDGSQWQYLPDHRGTTVYRTDSGEPLLIEAVGTLPADTTDTPRPTAYHQWDGKAKAWTLPAEAAAELLAQAKAAKLAAINQAAQDYISAAAHLDEVPEFEVQTWLKQGEEAKAWYADKTAATPTLDTIAAVRGVPPDLLKQKAYEKAIAFETLTASVAGYRQALADRIAAAKDMAALDAVVIDFGG